MTVKRVEEVAPEVEETKEVGIDVWLDSRINEIDLDIIKLQAKREELLRLRVAVRK
jgi:hypothetical protein